MKPSTLHTAKTEYHRHTKSDKPEFFIITESFCGGYGKFVCDEIKKAYRIKRSDSVLIFEKI